MQEVVAAPAAERSQVALSEPQRAYLTSEANFGVLARVAFGASLGTPLLLLGFLMRVTKIVSRVPVIGWLLAIYGFLATVVGVVGGIVLIPVVFLIVLPITLLGRRAKLHQDIESGSALRQTGSFEVIDNGPGGGSLVSPIKRFRLSAKDLERLKPALVEGDGEAPSTFNGTVVHAAGAGDLLGAYDESGRELYTAAS